jgi:ribosomal protein L32
MKKKNKTRRGGRERHPMQIQDAKMISKIQDKKRDLAHIKCFKCEDM